MSPVLKYINFTRVTSSCCVCLLAVRNASLLAELLTVTVAVQKRIMIRGISLTLALLATTASAGTVLMDASGDLFKQMPNVSTSGGVVAVVSSPGTPSLLPSSSEILSLEEGGILSCRGATLSATSASERTSLAATSLVAGAVIVDGITEGDVETGLTHTRHSRTLTALFRARLASGEEGQTETKQTLMLGVVGFVDETMESTLLTEVNSIFEAAAVGTEASLDDMYTIQVVSLQTQSDASQVRKSISKLNLQSKVSIRYDLID